MSIAPLEPRASELETPEQAAEAEDAAFEAFEGDEPTSLPRAAWVSLIGFALFVVGFGTCAANWMFS